MAADTLFSRPKVKSKPFKQLHVDFTEADWELLVRLTHARKLSASELVRVLIRENAPKTRVRSKKGEADVVGS